MTRNISRKASAGLLAQHEYALHLHFIAKAHEHARKGRILYLKHSGERITDLRSLPDEELQEWYASIRSSNERQAQQQRERIERLRMQQPKRT